jgi:outer membrane lipoprotein-sorting protein
MNLMVLRIASVLFTAACGAISAGAPADPALQEVLARLDQSSATFKSFSANMQRLTHTDVINSDDIDKGTIKLKRSGSKSDLKMLIDITEPDAKTVSVQGKKGELYYPKMATIQEYDLGKYRDWVDQFYLMGFGTTSKELQGNYAVRLLGSDTKDGQKVTGMELIPKNKEILQHIRKFELWLSDKSGLPVEQKIYPAGQYVVITYSNAKINPDLPDSALKLQVPKETKREYPQKAGFK